MLTAIKDAISEQTTGLAREQLSVCVGYTLLGGTIVTQDWRPYHNDRDAVEQEAAILEQRVHALLTKGDITPDCQLIEMHTGSRVGVAVGGQGDIGIQSMFANAIATDVQARYQELSQ